ncbi:SEL1-like repeat protein [Trinickia sp.]|uniref:SEL1-like repeat protein n=1 Tax=Trinickia sp. TaxID=2571163 RepID=UPI003F7F020C
MAVPSLQMTRIASVVRHGIVVIAAMASLAAQAASPSLHGAAGNLAAGGPPLRIPFSDSTSPCDEQWGGPGGAFRSPWLTPANMRSVCAAEAAKGNLDAQVVYGQLVLYGFAGVPDEAGFAMLRSAAVNGHAIAQRIVGQLYQSGNRVPRDRLAGRWWLNRAAASGDGVAADALGMLDYTGDGGPPDLDAAYRRFVQAATHDDARGATNAGRMLAAGWSGTPKNPRGAAAWYIRGAVQGDADGQFLLGRALLLGEGVTQDEVKAFGWLSAAVRQNQRDAKALLAELYLRGRGAPSDPRHGFALLLDAANQGTPYAQRRVGELYAKGTGVAPNEVIAQTWFRRAALNGDAIGQYELALSYRTGTGGPVDLDGAIAWMRSAAGAGLAPAQNDLGTMLQKGEGGPPDVSEAREWYERASAQGLGVASRNLSAMAAQGLGMPRDEARAYRYAKLGAERGDARSELWVGSMLSRGIGVAAQPAAGLAWQRKAADDGDMEAQLLVSQRYLSGVGVPRDEALGKAYLQRAADQGDARAQTVLAGLLLKQSAVTNRSVAKAWLLKAVAQHFGPAYALMGELESSGTGAPPDVPAAMAWFARGAALNDGASERDLCLAYANAAGPAHDTGKALHWCTVAATAGDRIAMGTLASGALTALPATTRAYWQWRLASMGDAAYGNMLGEAYDLGEGVPVDHGAALYWLRHAATQGNATAQSALARHLFSGIGGQHDDYEAFAWANRSAVDSADGMMLVGESYLMGRGVEQNVAAALQWLTKAADAGSAQAANDLANCYETGEGVARDPLIAQRWYRKAAALGSEEASIALALKALREGGELSVVSAREQFWLARRAADPLDHVFAAAADSSGERDGQAAWRALSALDRAGLSQPFAQFETGILFFRGEGVTQDKALGDAWLRHAQATLSTRDGWRVYALAAQEVEARVRASLTEAEKARADRLAASLQATVPDGRPAMKSAAMI